jgi:hypothetical protein
MALLSVSLCVCESLLILFFSYEIHFASKESRRLVLATSFYYKLEMQAKHEV